MTTAIDGRFLVPLAHRPLGRRRAAVVVGLTALALTASCSADNTRDATSSGGTGSSAAASTSSLTSGGTTPGTGIHRATTDDVARDGHFSDPYPLSGTTAAGGPPDLVFSGTFSELITCRGPIRPGCFRPAPIHVGFSEELRQQLDQHGVRADTSKAHHIYHRADGSWHMVFASRVEHGNQSWNLIFHARPAGAVSGDSVPTRWTGDTLLTGSLDRPTGANYDGKLYDDHGRLYLVYSGRLQGKANTFGVVAQPMASPSRLADAPPITLLAPERGDAALNSENRFGIDQDNEFKLVETGNIVELAGKYVMVYAVGAFDRADYKIGIAYSDSFRPSGGSGYRKVRMDDPSGVWGHRGANEVRYLLQSQARRWPNYVRSSVQAPGVGSLIRSDGRWVLFFAGYGLDERADSDGKFTAPHRQPYFVPATVSVPRSPSVRDATNAQLTEWVTPALG